MKELKNFPECDGHIESILIGCRIVKVSFQTWDAKKLVLIYTDVENDLVLSIIAKSVKIFEVGENADINNALFDVGYEYIGGQELKP